MFLPRGIPQDVDDETARKIAHSFYVVRMVRYALLVGFLVVFMLAVELSGWPQAAAVVFGLVALAVVGLMLVTRHGYLRSQRPPSESPTG